MKKFQSTVLIVFLLFTGSCSSSTIATTPTITPCPTIIQDNTEKQSTFYFFLIDGTEGFFENGSISSTKVILNESLNSLLQSGDRVVLAWINKALSGVNDSIFFYSTFIFQTDGIEPTLTPPPYPTSFQSTTATPTSTPKGQLAQEAAAAEIAEAQAAEAEAINDYFCTLGENHNTSKEINQKIEEIKMQEATRFLSDIQNLIPLDEEFYGDNTLNPSFESIKMASDFMSTQCTDNYDNCLLVTFSNMTDPRRVKETIEDPQLISDFNKKVEVVSFFYDCKFVDGECEDRINDWSRHFNNFNTTGFNYLLNPYAGTQSQDSQLTMDFIKTIKNIQMKQ